MSDFDSNTLNEHQRELSHFAILSLQKHDGFDVQFSGSSRYSSLYCTPDPLGDLLFTAYSRGMGKNVVSSQFNFSADSLAYIQQHYIHLDHDQRFTGSGGAAYTVGYETQHPTRLSADLLVGSGLRQSGDTPNGRAEPGYCTFNLSAVQTPQLVGSRPTELRVDMINLLDRRYELRNGTGVGAPQYGLRRAILAGVTQRF